VPGTVRQALLAVGHALRGVRPAGFAAVARLLALPSAGPGTPFGPRRPRCARGSPRRLRRRGPAPGLALRRLGNPVRASSATVCAGFAPPASPPWPGSGLRPPPAREPRSGSVGYGAARGSPRRLRRRGPAPGLALRRLGNPVRASSATVCAGFAPPASPPWPGSGPSPPSAGSGTPFGLRRPRCARGSPRRLRRRGPAPGFRPPPAREPRSGLVGHGVRGVRPAGFAAVARLRALPSAGPGTPREADYRARHAPPG
jgi:hypothetical protein